MNEHMLLKNSNVFDVEKGIFRNNIDILVENDIIKEIGKVSEAGEESLPHIDCSGKFALPGLFECHAHLAFLTTEGAATKQRMLKEFVLKGITQVRDVGGPLEILKKMTDEISSGELLGPEIFYAGPMLEKSPLHWEKFNKELPGFTVAINTKEDARSIIQELSNGGARLVKTFNKFDVEIFKCLISEAEEHNLPVTLDTGSPPFYSIPMDMAIDLGVRCFEHAKAPWTDVLKNDIKLEYNKLLAAEVGQKEDFQSKILSLSIESISPVKLQQLIDKILQNNVYMCPTLHALQAFAKHPPDKKPEEMSKDQLKEHQRRIEIYSHIFSFFTRELIKRNTKILVGQDGDNPEFTLDEMQLLKECGLPESEIIKGATIYPAEWLGVYGQLGSISPKKKANILILNRNPLENIQNIKTVHAVLQNGRIVFQES